MTSHILLFLELKYMIMNGVVTQGDFVTGFTTSLLGSIFIRRLSK